MKPEEKARKCSFCNKVSDGLKCRSCVDIALKEQAKNNLQYKRLYALKCAEVKKLKRLK